MLMANWEWLHRYPLRVRLTAWYLLLLGLVLLLFSSFLYIQLRLSLFAQLDASLKLTESYARNHLDQQQTPPVFNARTKNLSRYMHQGNYSARLIRLDGTVWHGLGDYPAIPAWVPKTAGYYNLQKGETTWRIYSQPISPSPQGPLTGWLQISHSLAKVQESELNFLRQVLISLPLALVIAGGGGWLLAKQALWPIARITHTAQIIEAGNLAQRIDYQGPADEVGQLATTLDQMLDRIQAAFDRERHFTADVSHELRTPLTVMKGQISVTLQQLRHPQDYENRLYRIEQSVDRLIRLTNDLLYLTRLDQGRLDCPMEPINLTFLLEATVEQTQVLADSKQIDIVTYLAPNLMVLGHPDHLIRLFLNLLDNAIQHTPAGGQVILKAAEQENVVAIILQDTGKGIPPEHLPHVFERFYRVEPARDRVTGGAGLGLAIAHEIAAIHTGALTVESQVGSGTCFNVCLPKAGSGSQSPSVQS
jgi:heavy metal sensor kinase